MKLPDDPFILELLPEFIDTWINDLETQFQSIIDSKNSDVLYRFGHTLKGSCFQFGLDDVAAMGIELMGFSKEQNWEKALELYPTIKSSFDEVKQFLIDNKII